MKRHERCRISGRLRPPVKYHYSYCFFTYPVRRGGEARAGSHFWCQAPGSALGENQGRCLLTGRQVQPGPFSPVRTLGAQVFRATTRPISETCNFAGANHLAVLPGGQGPTPLPTTWSILPALGENQGPLSNIAYIFIVFPQHDLITFASALYQIKNSIKTFSESPDVLIKNFLNANSTL